MSISNTFGYKQVLSVSALAMALSLTACGGNKTEESVATEATDAPVEVVRIATEGAYPPLNFTQADGSLAGFDVDVAHALCEQMKTNCEIVQQDWAGIIPSLQAEKYDAIIAGMSITEDRKKVVDFTDPYFSSGLVLIGKAGEAVTFDSLAGKNVGAQKGTVAVTYLEENYPDIKVKTYDTQENANMDLVSGRVDAVLVDKVVGLPWLASDDGKDYAQMGEIISTSDDDFGIALRKGDELVGKFNTALAEIKANGTYEQISVKYFGAK